MYMWAIIFCVIPLFSEIRIWCVARSKYRVVRQLEDEQITKREQSMARLAKYWVKHDREQKEKNNPGSAVIA